ncbi:BRO-B [Betabaculovirus altermyunipunctae]|uniref:BRO-B n=1 Tax=Betabaculovirus altermyunipunctae TaxID=3051996 RepID=A0A1S5YDY0_9BBAC|nr:BRO-B [Betabaculovirus altermyunipunctae]AQQ80321.1 BRO-B [Betabaculovirus altermyunipunctae]
MCIKIAVSEQRISRFVQLDMSFLSRQLFSVGDKSCHLWIVKVEAQHGDTEHSHFFYIASPLAEFLGLPTQDIRQNAAKPEWCKSWQQIRLMIKSAQFCAPHDWQPNTLFLAEGGVHAFVVRSQLPEALKLHEWLFQEVTPKLRRDGHRLCRVKEDNYRIMLEEARMEAQVYTSQLNKHYMTRLHKKDQDCVERLTKKDREFVVQTHNMRDCYNWQIYEYKTRDSKHKTEIEQLKRKLGEQHDDDDDGPNNKRLRIRSPEQHPSDKSLKIKCDNATVLWNRVTELQPHMCFGFRFTSNGSCAAEIQFLTAEEIVDKYREHVQMCAENKDEDRARIEHFKAMNLLDEEDAVRKCFTPSVAAHLGTTNDE